MPSSDAHHLSSSQRLLISLPRSGTHWLKLMISHALGAGPLDRRLLDPADLRRAIEEESRRRLIYEHLDFGVYFSVVDPASRPDLRIVLLYRNPVDALISAFHRREPGNPGGALKKLKRYLRGCCDSPLEPGSLYLPLRAWLYGRVVGWLQSGYCLPVRYEDLVADTASCLRVILDYLHVPHTRKGAIEATIRRNTFQRLSGGRSPGIVDSTSHYRRGIPGEWREVLNEHDLEAVHREIGDYLHILGYDMAESHA